MHSLLYNLLFNEEILHLRIFINAHTYIQFLEIVIKTKDCVFFKIIMQRYIM